MSNKDPNNPVDFSPVGAKEMGGDYKDRINAAKQGSAPVGAVPMPENVPRFDHKPPSQSRPTMPQPMTPEQYHEAVAQGRAVPGVGGAYPVNQPTAQQQMMGQGGNPVNPPRPEGGLRPETIDQLNEVAKANKEGEEENEDELSDEEFFARLGRATEDLISNRKRRKAIEEKITDELNFDDLITRQEIRQEVPVRRGFQPTFREPSAEEDLFVKRLISPETNVSPRYLEDKLAIMNLTCGLYSINGKPLPNHLNSDGVPQEEEFWKKFKFLVRYPLIIVADLSANFVWFRDRVTKLLSIDEVKNF